MLTVFRATLSPMLVMLICILAGFILRKCRILPDNSDRVLSRLETYILMPALNIRTFMQNASLSSLAEHSNLLLICSGVVVVAILIAYALAGRMAKEPYQKNLYRYSLTISNFGFMGNAIVPMILGEDMLYPYLLFTLPPIVCIYTWGMAMLIPADATDKKSAWRRLLNPGTVSVLIGLLLGVVGAQQYTPPFIQTTLGNLSDCMGPVAMVLTGFVIGSYPLKSLFNKPAVYVASLLRLIILPALFVGALLLLNAPDTAVVLCLFAFGTPLGLNTIVFPAAYGGDTAPGAAMAMVSHAMCILTIPLMYALLTALM